MSTNCRIFPPKLHVDGNRVRENSFLAQVRAFAIRCLSRSLRASIVDLWNHMDSGRSIVASIEWTHRRVLQARRTVKHFATSCISAPTRLLPVLRSRASRYPPAVPPLCTVARGVHGSRAGLPESPCIQPVGRCTDGYAIRWRQQSHLF